MNFSLTGRPQTTIYKPLKLLCFFQLCWNTHGSLQTFGTNSHSKYKITACRPEIAFEIIMLIFKEASRKLQVLRQSRETSRILGWLVKGLGVQVVSSSILPVTGNDERRTKKSHQIYTWSPPSAIVWPAGPVLPCTFHWWGHTSSCDQFWASPYKKGNVWLLQIFNGRSYISFSEVFHFKGRPLVLSFCYF